jgi:hypothetical protein
MTTTTTTITEGTVIHYLTTQALHHNQYSTAYRIIGQTFPTMPISEATKLIDTLTDQLFKEQQVAHTIAVTDDW